ncbi:dihydroxyacetone kinase subunit DhaK [Mesoplasma lactucae]|uniref:Dihydroxyacetone kinase n=1 Tax=Mesoplasma lactucae ATCC 49193 TaxID=81460 RepID=A0A291IRQ2_9MOLU|nr:dihydroxyacetone kinase subunit DhaK [Mesoplasma lactucae]ATG97440.1 dihydroxyacetone kinase [Mesoplasma lactucae ATCC 49193]ATZ20106.1 dihydroxyacetone kinase subunit DhaK [Mesoplasma lactucae ATCC 49193]MCL8216854.1 PTS-dependent dihydroxyacetone kinase, dihydroxyacetone-binding subunit DhaK [Mesoplasma lactucae ATCC 49193]
MKKFMNDIEDIVSNILEGLALAYPDIVRLIPNSYVITRKEFKNPNKVSIISGCGTGHEPAPNSYVGEGMLDAGVVGEVFTSPTPDQILKAIENVPTKNGVLLVLYNYTGDRINFRMALQAAQQLGVKIDFVVISDDIATEEISEDKMIKRGLAGGVLVTKIIGAKAEQNASLEELKEIGVRANKNTATIGIAANGTTIPTAGFKGFELDDFTVEYGVGAHGERGVRQEPIQTADVHVQEIMPKLIAKLDLKKGDKVALLVNGLGGTPQSEFFIVARKAILMLNDEGIILEKAFVGNYFTSIDMPGFSISLMKLDDEMAKLMQQRANTIGLKVV